MDIQQTRLLIAVPSATALEQPPHCSNADSSLGWQQAGFIIFAFAAPSACVGVGYSIGMVGLLGGTMLCMLATAASIGGSLMLVEAKVTFPECQTFGDLGGQLLGRSGQIWGNMIQLGNFLLYLPVALLFCASALEGLIDIAAFDECIDYYIFCIAALCFLSTQARSLKNTQFLSMVSLVCVFIIAIIQIIAAFMHDTEAKVPVMLFGNSIGDPTMKWTKCFIGITAAAWSYVPAFLTVELTSSMRNPEEFKYSLYLSGFLNVMMFVVVGCTLTLCWGYDLEDPIMFSKAWPRGSVLDKLLNAFLLISNYVSYTLDSVPLGRYCQKKWAPNFSDTWTTSSIFAYMGYTLPTFSFGVLLSVAVPNLLVLLTFITALTVPWVTQIFPAVLFWKLREHRSISVQEKLGVATVFVVGCLSFIICSIAAIGKVSFVELRGHSQIGCTGWLIWQG